MHIHFSLAPEELTTLKDHRPQCQHRLRRPQCSEPNKCLLPMRLTNHNLTQLEDVKDLSVPVPQHRDQL